MHGQETKYKIQDFEHLEIAEKRNTITVRKADSYIKSLEGCEGQRSWNPVLIDRSGFHHEISDLTVLTDTVMNILYFFESHRP